MHGTITQATYGRTVSSTPAPFGGVPAWAPAGSADSKRSVLDCLPSADRQALMRWSTQVTVAKRDLVFRQGDPAASLFVVQEGYVKLSAMVDNREVVLQVLGPGDCFGDVSVLNHWPRATDAAAVTRCRLLAIDGRQFRLALERRPETALAVMRLVSTRLHAATQRIVDALALPAPARLAKVLMLLTRLHATGAEQPGGVRLLLSQSELGSMSGLTRESVNKHLNQWREAGWILLSGGAVTLLDPEALTALAQDDAEPMRRSA
jgi:CRP-like cAMP-binding protein